MPATIAGLPLPMNPLPQPADYCSTSNIEAIAKALTGRRIVILGLARQGLALARFFCSCGANVAVSDLASADTLQAELAALGDLPVELALGSHPLSLLDGCDLLCLSGGVPPQSAFVAEAARHPLSNDSLLSLQIAKALDLGPAVAITGSSGKTTTTTLTGEMLAGQGERCTSAAISVRRCSTVSIRYSASRSFSNSAASNSSCSTRPWPGDASTRGRASAPSSTLRPTT